MTKDPWSSSESDVLADTCALVKGGGDGVLATIIRVEGSAYRRSGAKMLISSDGDSVGSVSAGCLEGEIRRLADAVVADDRPRIETFDLTNDDDVWNFGLGCNGVINLLLEPVDERYQVTHDAYEADRSVATLIVTESTSPDVERWARALYRPETGIEYPSGTPEYPKWLVAKLPESVETLATRGESDTLRFDGPSGEVDVFVDGIAPPPELVVFGTGRDLEPVVELAARNGFRVTVVGFRGGVDIEAQFPDADAHVSTSPADVVDGVSFDENTYAVVATHNFVDDRITVGELVDTPTPYIGIMGPQKRFDEMFAAFEDEDRTLSDSELERIYTPVGLDLGSETPVQIATSIVSEILAVDSGRRPRHLRERTKPIHERVESSPVR